MTGGDSRGRQNLVEPATSAPRTIRGRFASVWHARNCGIEENCLPPILPELLPSGVIQDDSGHSAQTPLESALREVIGGGNDGNGTERQPGSPTSGEERGIGKPLWEVVRLLVEMDPDERTALVGLLRALG